MHILVRGIIIVYFHIALVLGFWLKRDEREWCSRIDYTYMDGTLLEPVWRYPISPIVEWLQINRRFIICSLLTLSGVLKLLPYPHPRSKIFTLYRSLSLLVEGCVGIPQIWAWLHGLISDNSLEPMYYPSALVDTAVLNPPTYQDKLQFLLVKSSMIGVVCYGIYLTKKAMRSLGKKERWFGVVSYEHFIRTVVILVVGTIVFWMFIVNHALSVYFDTRMKSSTYLYDYNIWLFVLFLVFVLYALLTQCQEFHVKVFLVGASLFVVNLLFQEIYRSYLLGHVFFISSSHLILLHYLCYYSTLGHISTNKYSNGYREYENIAENSAVKLVRYIQILFGIIQLCVSVSLLRFFLQWFSYPKFQLEKQFSELVTRYMYMFLCTLPNIIFLIVVFGYRFDGRYLPYKFAVFPSFRKDAFRFTYDYWSPGTIPRQQFKAVGFIILYYIYTFKITPNEINFLFADIVTIEVFLLSVRVAFTFPQGTSPFDALETVHWSKLLDTDESCFIPLKTSFEQYKRDYVIDEEEKQAKHPGKGRNRKIQRSISAPNSLRRGRKCKQGQAAQTKTIDELKKEFLDETFRQGHRTVNNISLGNMVGCNFFFDCNNTVQLTENNSNGVNVGTADDSDSFVLDPEPNENST